MSSSYVMTNISREYFDDKNSLKKRKTNSHQLKIKVLTGCFGSFNTDPSFPIYFSLYNISSSFVDCERAPFLDIPPTNFPPFVLSPPLDPPAASHS